MDTDNIQRDFTEFIRYFINEGKSEIEIDEIINNVATNDNIKNILQTIKSIELIKKSKKIISYYKI